MNTVLYWTEKTWLKNVKTIEKLMNLPESFSTDESPPENLLPPVVKGMIAFHIMKNIQEGGKKLPEHSVELLSLFRRVGEWEQKQSFNIENLLLHACFQSTKIVTRILKAIDTLPCEYKETARLVLLEAFTKQKEFSFHDPECQCDEALQLIRKFSFCQKT